MPNKQSTLAVSDWLLQLHDDLSTMRQMAVDRQTTTQKGQKSGTTRLPHQGHSPKETKYLSSLQPSQEIEAVNYRTDGMDPTEQISPVTYRVDRPNTAHVTALKGWFPPISNIACLFVENSDLPDIPDSTPDRDVSFPELQSHLTQEQCEFSSGSSGWTFPQLHPLRQAGPKQLSITSTLAQPSQLDCIPTGSPRYGKRLQS